MNLFQRAFRRNPYALYRLMRRVSPVYHDRRRKLWILFDFDSVKRALNDQDAFSSQAAPPGGEPLQWLIFLDPPMHSRMRALIMRTFAPRTVSGLEASIRARATALLDAVIDRDTMDLVADFADPLPLMVIADMIGIPSTDKAPLRKWTNAILNLGDTVAGGEIAARAIADFRAAKEEMRPYLRRLVGERRAEPKDDLLTRLLQAEVDGERLSEDDIEGFFHLLLLAGSETTTNLISGAVLTLLDHPRQHALLLEDRSLLPAAIEEVLRYRSPVQLVFRVTRKPVEMHGRMIPSGELVLAVVGSANRDPRQFAHPSRFDVKRAPNQHVAFGHGAHFCIGAALARLEARVALSELFDRVTRLKRSGSRLWEPRKGLNVHGPARYDVQFEKR